MSEAWAAGEIERRLANLIRLATVSALDANAARVKVQIGAVVSDWLPWVTHRASNDRSWWAPEPGEQVLVLSPSGDLTQAVVLPAIYQANHSAPADSENIHRVRYKDGTVVEYDRAAHRLLADLGASKITMDRDHILLESNGSTLELDQAGIRLNGARIDLN